MKTFIPVAAAFALAFGVSQGALADALQQDAAGADSVKTFEEVDANADGSISKEEATAAGVEIDWATADPDGSGSLTREEYMSATESTAEPAAGDSSAPGSSM